MDLAGGLKKYFGYDQFRPLQQEIIQDALAGRDVLVLMPTGGGKSLCFQLPALIREGLTIVVSPLISLMKDQVDALQTSGISATCLNSTLDPEEAKVRWRGLHRGQYRMLYVAPERLMLDTFLERALNWNVAQLAIDEAHCISEWGHDFRPEYRELKKLRKDLPDVPMMALTATATERVRADIIKELKLRDPRCYVASFNRPNLTYRVVPKTTPYEQLLAFIRSRPNDSGIVYCASRKSTESLARNLNEDGIGAKPYHAGLTTAEREELAKLRKQVRELTMERDILMWNDHASNSYAGRLWYGFTSSFERTRQRSRGVSRRLITLMSAGRNRMVVIRRELPLTNSAGRSRSSAA